ncbi:hypothetical protein OH76DRAFT_1488067 [Lentinus brumalis]|uniref:Uncharacterized protein n=1 Tax=Lentinus brumalis TaxID=2498619 RepID=A0A371CSD6_9APHY|nr:hypothetical protein OH76DRAFT_1488067 [Polyporus brumalis]
MFASHAVGGVIGNVLTVLFAQASVAGFDGVTRLPGGWLDQHYIPLRYQVADSVSGMSYSVVITTNTHHPAQKISAATSEDRSSGTNDVLGAFGSRHCDLKDDARDDVVRQSLPMATKSVIDNVDVVHEAGKVECVD